MPYLVSYHVPIWRVHHSKTNPPMDPISHEALHCTPSQHSQAYSVKGRLWSAPEAMRCEQGVFFAIFHICMCPIGRQRARPSKAPQVEHICGIEGGWCRVIVFRRIGRLLNPSRRY